ncbi:zinc finger CCCH domain-containing protein 17 [Phtheirospermum japonicum]|uniref:Zinc finger CCCH domain-containing protein 17 n=1 Tax=Phtheirospermum japonicum TaxID=374723 RepID=A0A830C0D6_9LAMI|nr:zinc finger CCCH domain-containing protein 17 [Phtheirospermum japonicum]
MASSAPQSQSQPLSAEDEALKRNTDCVYFLASPLTCKKGNECEYRHSDVARINPRDCYFWLHGNCLNPKCAFRHPPLEGLLGAQAPTPTGPSAPVSQTVSAPTPHVPNTAPTKPGVPCVFFQKGYCMKGDWCPFLHLPISLSNKPSSMPLTAPPVEPATNKKALIGLEKSVQDKKVPPVNVSKSVKDTAGAKSSFEVEPSPTRNEFFINRRAPQITPVSNGNPVNWPVRLQQSRHLDDPEPEPENMNSKDVDEFSREPSPGFDVLVDDDVRDADYYPGEDRYGMSRDHESRSEYDIGLSSDYNTIPAGDNDERYQGPIGYDSHEHRKGQYGWDPQRGSSVRSGGPYIERRPFARPDNVDLVDELDLRHRLANHKKPNGLRSVISHENARDKQFGDRRGYRESSRENNSLSNRLRGRISLPGRRPPSPNNRGPDRGRLSPVRANMTLHQGRIRDKIRGRVDEGFNNGGRNYRGPQARRDDSGDDRGKFAGPKSLAELKNKKNGEPSRRDVNDQQQSSLGKRKHIVNQESGNGLSFEGPKPLQEILKRKRGETVRNEDKVHEVAENETQVVNHDSTSVQKSEPVVDNKQEIEDGMIDDGADQEESEAVYEQRNGESDYEQVGGEDYDLYDGENDGDNVDYADEDDDDDFAKKMGVMYS